MSRNIRNICIIAHVDHGKTTLVDHLFQATGVVKTVGHEERLMDSGALEKERGITIQAKNAACVYLDHKINIMDTPGHADFGGEVERVLSMADSSVILVDAAEGPLPQTRFVLQKALAHGHRFILCINKVDRPEIRGSDRVQQVVDKTFDLFVELGATDAQCDFPIVYACAKDGWCTLDYKDIDPILAGEKKADLLPLLDLVIKQFPEPKVVDGPFQLLISNLDYSDYVGQIAIGRIISGKVNLGDRLYRHGVDAQKKPIVQSFSVTKLYTYIGMKQIETQTMNAGDIAILSGCDDFQIGDTLAALENATPLKRIEVEVPTMSMVFTVNSSPFAGQEGEAIQSRKLRERLLRECRKNVAFKFEVNESTDECRLLGRGELQFAILIEQMRREGLEFMVGRPAVVFQKDESGQTLEPIERITADLPEEASSAVTELLQKRKGILVSYENLHSSATSTRVRLQFEIPTRGLLGIRSYFLTLTKGEGIMSSEFARYDVHKGELLHRNHGAIISDRTGKTIAYALEAFDDRGVLFYGPGVKIYEGMIIGEHNRDNDLNVNACKEKKLTNVRSTSSDGITILAGTRNMTLDKCLEFIDDDEWLEVTPENVRMRKKILAANLRSVIRKDKR
ncbi:MAG: translational GTPase TypA [Oligoflexales bacterium]|nr:translational GTPase TypA [Oligoflexales bacterium]